VEPAPGRASPPDPDRLDWLGDSLHPLDWNGPTARPFTSFGPDALDRPIIEHLRETCEGHADRLALTDRGRSITYAQLWAAVNGLAEQIAAGSRPEELIGILMPPSALFPVAILACLAAGRAFVPLDPGYPAEWLAQVLEDARPGLIIGQAPAAGPSVPVLPLAVLPGAPSSQWRAAALGVDAPACVLFTSGSTGRPKGVVNSQRGLLQRAVQSINAAHINAGDRFLTLASPCTVVGVRDLATAMLAGASLHLIDTQAASARMILNLIRSEAITILFAFPAHLRSVLAAADNRRAPSGLRLVRMGGDTILWSDIDLLRAWLAPGAAIQSIYAATEAPMMQWFVVDAARGEDPRVPIGYPLPGNLLALADETGRTPAPGETGELIVRSPFVALGLWREGHLVPGPAGGAGRLFRSGDLVRRRPDGLLERLGRLDRQVKVRGVRVELDGLEALLRRHPQVRDAAALVRPTGDGRLIAYVSPHEGASAGLAAELRALLRAAPVQMRPAELLLVDDIPRLPNSKPDLARLVALDEAAVRDGLSASRPVLAPGDAIEQAAALAWTLALGRAPATPDDDFFDLGGDSLRATGLMIELERALGAELPLTLINEAPTFAGFCQALRQRRPDRYQPLVQLKAGEGTAPLFFVHGLGGNVVDLFPVARSMAWPGEVIGVQARGLSRQEPAHASVQAMADEYVREIRARQPQGPYHVCGYSFGGLVAFEIARRLARSGADVGLVGLFDTTTHAASWPIHVWLAFLRRRAVQIGRAVLGRPEPGRTGPSLWTLMKAAPAGVLKVAASALMASARYRPVYYPGTLTLFTPEERDPALPSPAAVWRRHAAQVQVVGLPGGHFSMLTPPNALQAAAALSSRLNRPWETSAERAPAAPLDHRC
jgi:amino acid adenylation domain-containing protein